MNTSCSHLNLRFVFAFLLMMASASTIHAQGAAPLHKWFVTGSLLRSRDRPVRFEDRSSDPLFQTTGWDVAAGLGMGAFVSDRWSARAEVEIPQRGQTEYWTSPSQQPPLRIIEWTRQEITRRHTTTAGLLGFHVRRSSRIRPSFLVSVTVLTSSPECGR